MVYKLVVYYKVISRFRQGQLMLSTVDARTNRGNYNSRTEWKGDYYEISANQYKHTCKAIESEKIDFSITMLYFSEPVGRQRVYVEYFGDYFSLIPGRRGGYRARLANREAEYFYEKGQLVRVIKKNTLKNFTIRLLE